jgi:hypothetical protein
MKCLLHEKIMDLYSIVRPRPKFCFGDWPSALVESLIRSPVGNSTTFNGMILKKNSVTMW